MQTSNVAQPKAHLPCLTALRGIAALWVMIFHMDVIVYYRELGSLVSPEKTGLLTKGYLGVDFFFILSGFVIAHVYAQALRSQCFKSEFGRYLWARFSRIYPLHVFTLVVAILASSFAIEIFPQIRDGSWDTFFAWRAIPSNLLLTHAMNQHVYLSWNMASWSIGAEWWTYILATPLIIFISENRLKTSGVCAVLAFVALCFMANRLGSNSLDITFDYGFIRCYLEFILGLFLYSLFRYLKHQALNTDKASIFTRYTPVVLILLVPIFSHFKVNDLYYIPTFMLLILSASLNNGRFASLFESKLLVYIGNISYSIYLIHSLFFLVYWFLLPELSLTLSDGQLLLSTKIIYAMSFASLTWICADLSYRHIEVPSRKRLRNLQLNSWRFTNDPKKTD